MSINTQDIKKEEKQYWLIFLALLALNAFVLLSRGIHILFWIGIFAAFTVVISFFMHLKSEKKAVQATIAVAILSVIGMVVLILGSYYSVPEGTQYINYQVQPKPAATHEATAHHGS
jgi:predicted PurR-regulated permease PerM